MTRIPLLMLCALAVALVFSVGPLVLAGGWQGGERSAVAPFGWNQVVVAHAISTLPLSWMLAVAATQVWPILSRRWTVLLWVIAAVDIAGLGIFSGNFVAAQLNALHAGPYVRMAVRIGWCLLLQLPWCLAARALQSRDSSDRAGNEFHQTGEVRPLGKLAVLNYLCWAIVVAIFVPMSFVNSLTAKQTQVARQYWKELRIEKARNLARRLCDAGSTHSFGDSSNTDIIGQQNMEMPQHVPPQQALAMLAENVKYLSGRIKALREVETTEPQQLHLGLCYASLDRFPQAREVLEPLAKNNPEAAVKLAEICQWEERWPQAREWLALAVDLARNEKTVDSEAAARRERLLVFAYDSLARGAREMKQYDLAETYYKQAIDALPSRAAHFYSQLAAHCDLGGRPGDAIEFQRMAYELNPEKYPEPSNLTIKILSNSTPVGIFAPAASNHE